MKTHLFLLLSFCLLCVCVSGKTSHGVIEPVKPTFLYGSEERVSYNDDAEIHNLYKPLERPQIRFKVIHAAHVGDSCWVVIRIGVPYLAVKEGERFTARISSESAPAVVKWEYTVRQPKDDARALEMAPGKINCCYYSSKFAYSPDMPAKVYYTIETTIQSEHYKYRYQPLTLPVNWLTYSRAWDGAEGLAKDMIFDNSPVPVEEEIEEEEALFKIVG